MLSAATPPTWLGGAHYLLIVNLVITILRLAGATSLAAACAITPAAQPATANDHEVPTDFAAARRFGSVTKVAQ